jgi:ribonuclease P protein component
MGRCRRLRSDDDFRSVYDGGRRWQGRFLIVYWRKNAEQPGPRLGVSIGKKHGNAVARNRIKRRLREVFRLSRSQLSAAVDVILAARVVKNEPPFGELVMDFRSAIEKINGSLSGPPCSDGSSSA